MTHLASSLPSTVEQGAVRRVEWRTEVVETDGGYEVRNSRWAAPLRFFDVSFPTAKRSTDTTYAAVIALYQEAQGSLHSFSFKDWSTGEQIAVRFDSPLTLTGLDRNLDHIETLTLREVRL